ncbi:hypothetical protein MOMA_08611 [Moraxella macacae 0408225]|uniref:Uncharacterized protein n=1 Tax=Moraxella macacae 0408225 TaxID=1230338 RepID=L2F6U9_9GAMM|nr:hypothetical protein [Moraxella macacae]ELA08610.1 hypothetical protein MOMA_08611 [Moraxella macacae 0408225]
MATKLIKTANTLRLVTGKLAPYLDINWQDYTLDELESLLQHVVRFELEHNDYLRHKDYKDDKGANVAVFRSSNLLKLSSLGDVLLVVQDGHFGV